MRSIKIFAFVLLLCTSTYVITSGITSEKSFIYNLKHQIYNIHNNMQSESARQALKHVVSENVDIIKISQFVMGKHWNLATEEQRKYFVDEYSKHFTKVFVNMLRKHTSNGDMIIMGSRKTGDTTYLVSGRFIRSENSDFTNVDFKITGDNNSFLINDIVISGISVAINQRSQFSNEMDTYGVAHVIDKLKKNNNK